MSTATVVLILAAAATSGVIPTAEVEKQNTVFQNLWETEFRWEFDKLPLNGGVESARVPYSGYIYPDTEGGTVHSLQKYDRAFNGGRTLAADHERWDTTAFKEPVDGFFGKLFKIKETPDWYGHCNGWTSAAIRHAEPVQSVTRNGVTFSPSDIKALLAELYIYNEHVVLAGENEAPIGAAAFHAIITNWLGRGEHPLGIEAEPGEEKWNYPAYAYAASAAKHSPQQVEVTMNVVYAADSRAEWDESPRIEEVKYFHYMLDLDADGKIVGGQFFHDSSSIDMLWVPLSPKEPGQPGNENGNPYINAEAILSLWRESVPSDIRATWLNVDPTEIIDRDLIQSPVADVFVASTEEVEAVELEVPTRIVSRSLTTAGVTAQSRINNCYSSETHHTTMPFGELLHGTSTATASSDTSPALIR
ncbi:MAG: hypothetical protein H6822_29525 [Planctomycetaceae bacterium]|nr:hypothetical protein [Planctomycetales bacterium]MCB9926324.1 hypothetical protein [Planctomycetaceae bacterium]